MFPARRWRSFGGPPNPGPTPARRGGGPEEPKGPKVWIDSGSGAGWEVPRDEAHRYVVVPPFATGTLSGVVRGPGVGDGRTVDGCLNSAPPDPVPHGVKGDAFLMLFARHTPISGTHCASGCLLGEDTGLCAQARMAKRGLEDLIAEQEELQADRESRERGGEFGAPPV